MFFAFYYDSSKCTACCACSVACMDQNDTDVTKGQKPFRLVSETWDKSKSGSESKPGSVIRLTRMSCGCLHCSEAPCAAACPSGCISTDGETGLVIYDSSSCTGCQNCSAACQYGAIYFNESGRMAKCDGCFERVKHGMEPACTRACPTGALLFRPVMPC